MIEKIDRIYAEVECEFSNEKRSIQDMAFKINEIIDAVEKLEFIVYKFVKHAIDAGHFVMAMTRPCFDLRVPSQ